MNDVEPEEEAMLNVIGGIVVYGFAMFGLGVYVHRVHAKRVEELGSN